MKNGRPHGCNGQCRFPAASNPILDNTGAYSSVGQSGKVWFLAGTTGSGAVPPVVRTITIPSGTPLFFPIVNYFWVNTPEYGDPNWSPAQEANARSILADIVDTATGFSLKIDGHSIKNLYDFRFQSTVAKCTIPPLAADNLFGADLVNNPYYCVADGLLGNGPSAACRFARNSFHRGIYGTSLHSP